MHKMGSQRVTLFCFDFSKRVLEIFGVSQLAPPTHMGQLTFIKELNPLCVPQNLSPTPCKVPAVHRKKKHKKKNKLIKIGKEGDDD